MKMRNFYSSRSFLPLAFLTVGLLLFVAALDANGQRRDFMTDAEIELVRDAQDIDLRIDVLTKMIDRRFAALRINAGDWTPPAKETEKWGAAPTGTRPELFRDIRRLLQKAVDDIDDVAEHDKNTLTQNKTTGKLFPKAVRSLSNAAARFTNVLKPLLNSSRDELERRSIIESIDLCEQIIDAAARLPAEVKKAKS